MGDFEDKIYVLVAIGHEGETEFWAVATSRERAIPHVRQHLPPGRMIAFTENSLTPLEAMVLGVRPNGVRKLRCAP
jgi:hypothetical protein